MDEELRGFLKSFARLAQLAEQDQQQPKGKLLAPVLAEHLGTDPGTVPLVVEKFASHRLADANIVLERLEFRIDCRHQESSVPAGPGPAPF